MAAVALVGGGALVGLAPNARADTTASVARAANIDGSQIIRVSGTQPAPLAAAGARLVGPASTGAQRQLRVYLTSPEQARLAVDANGVADPASPEYHHYLTVAQFRARYAPPPATTDVLNRYLRGFDVRVGALDPDGLSEPVSGTVTELAAALHTDFQQVRTARGTTVVGAPGAPGLPRSLASSVRYIDGLTPWIQVHDNVHVRATKTLPASDRAVSRAAPARAAASGSPSTRSPSTREPAVSGPTEGCGLDQLGIDGETPAFAMGPDDVGQAYQLSGFYNQGNAGQGQTIGLIEYDSYDVPAVEFWAYCLGATSTIYTEPDAAYPPPATPATIEATADIQTVMDSAPAANIAVYESANLDASTLDPFNAAITGAGSTAPPPSVISSSWDLCEPEVDGGSAFYNQEQALFQEAEAQGQTILVASGDEGSEGCYGTGNTQAENEQLAVDDPASNPLVTAVGGTASDTVTGPESVWNSYAGLSDCLGEGCGFGASGGGLSTEWPKPAYQPANAALQSDCTQGAGGCREVPDVSALAGDTYAVACTVGTSDTADCPGQDDPGDLYLEAIYGTSLAAPSWAASVALSNNRCGGAAGFLNPLLYTKNGAAGAALGSVTEGDNDLLGVQDGRYAASSSGAQNLATGLGYLGGASLASGVLCSPVQVTETAQPATMVEPGGTFTFNVVVTSQGQVAYQIASVVDDTYGDLSTRAGSTCGALVGATLPAGGTLRCSFTASFTGRSGARQDNTVTVSATDAAKTTVSAAGEAAAILTPARICDVAGTTTVTPTLLDGGVLISGQELRSPSGAYVLDMQSDGNLVEYLGTRVVFNAATGNHPGACAVMQADGNFVVYSATNAALFNTGTDGLDGDFLSLQDDSNIVVHQGNEAVYSTGQGGSTLRSGGRPLTSGQELLSPNEAYTVVMQSDGNLVEYRGTTALFNTRTAGHPGSHAVMQSDGNFVVYSPSNVALYNTHTSGHAGAYIVLQNDADLVVYASGKAVFANHA